MGSSSVTRRGLALVAAWALLVPGCLKTPDRSDRGTPSGDLEDAPGEEPIETVEAAEAAEDAGEETADTGPADVVPEVPSERGVLVVSHADQLSGCVDFATVTQPATSCTKRIRLDNTGTAPLRLFHPGVIEPGPAGAFSVQVFRGGASQPEPCAPLIGTELTGDSFGIAPNGGLDLAVTYSAPGAFGTIASLQLDVEDPVPGIAEITLCGGAPKGWLDVAPRPDSVLQFLGQTEVKVRRTVVLMNRGIAPVEILGVEIAADQEGDRPEAFVLTTPMPAGFDLAPSQIQPMTVAFSAGPESAAATASLFITYRDPLIPSAPDDSRIRLRLEGGLESAGSDRPVAIPGDAQQYAGARAGQPLTLDGSASQGRGSPIVPHGYTWFVASRPFNSRFFLNQVAAGPRLVVTPDVAGDYEFRLVVLSQPEGQDRISDEASVTVYVAP